MCLLAVISRRHPESPLIVAANRDEWLKRPATPMTVLRNDDPRIIGGRDEEAGGTWLAVNDAGLVVGLTNKPSTDKDPKKRSRGELPLMLAEHRRADRAVESFVESVRADEYNPCWLLVGDRQSLFYIDLTGDGAPIARQLPAGVHILENRALGASSPKATWVGDTLTGVTQWRGERLTQRLADMLRSHDPPEGADSETKQDSWRPKETEAACVHAGPYGTRSSSIVIVPPVEGVPVVRFTDAPPCTADWTDAASLWRR